MTALIMETIEVNANEAFNYRIENNGIYDDLSGLLVAKIVYQCVQCLDVFYTISEIHIHCNDCHKNFDKPFAANELIFNEKPIHRKSNPKSNRKSGKKCKQNVLKKRTKRLKTKTIVKSEDTNEDQLNELKANESQMESTIVCTFCPKIYKTEQQLEEHMNLHLNPHVCDYPDCGKKFARIRELKTHIQMHTKGEYKCDICGKVYPRSDSMWKHKKIHTKPRICDYPNCNKQFASNSNLKMHKMSHSSQKNFKCDVEGCPFATTTPIGLAAHIRTHSNERTFRCQWPDCDKLFKNQMCVRTHIINVHRREMKFRCEWPACDKQFTNKHAMIKHCRGHSGERPFRCNWPDCGLSFRSSEILKRHKYTHTGERPFKCDWPGCEWAFSALGTLGTHKKLIHKCEGIKRSRWDKRKDREENNDI